MRKLLLMCMLASVTLASAAAAQQRSQKGTRSTRQPTPIPATKRPKRVVPTHDQVQAIGRALWDHDREAYGVVEDARWQPRLTDIMHRLGAATGIPGLELQYTILDDDDVNASAYPGGYMAINKGLLRFVDSITTSLPESARESRVTSYAAAVLGHELAHVTLGHVDDIVDEVLRREAASGGPGLQSDPRHFRSILDEFDPQQILQLRRSREKETAADLTGALYLARAGWEIQSAIDVMDAFDRQERGDPRRKPQIGELSWLKSHPRSAARVAALEGFRAQLKAHQAELDDALTLVANDADPRLAISLLDKVLADFPNLPAARHARAAAVQQQYFAAVPVQLLRVRPSTPTFSSRYLLGIRGASEAAQTLLTQSRASYDSILSVEVQPYTLSNLAVLDAYAGDLSQARARATRATTLAPNDLDVLNNRGVVEYLAGDRSAARATFEHVVQVGGDTVPPRVLFNYARVLIEVGDPEGPGVMQEYLATEGGSSWERLGRSLLRGANASMPETGPRVSASSPAPSVAGVSLGATRAQVIAALGAPDAEETDTAASISMLKYPDKGLAVVVDRAGVQLIVLLGANTDAIDGIRIGDPISQVRSKWGIPTEDRNGTLFFERGPWFKAADRGTGLVRQMAVGRRDP